jgi:hypothetical protein
MKKLLTALLAAVTLATSYAPADAQDWRYRRPGGYYHHHHRGGGGDAAAAAAVGLVGGLILGGIAAQASQPSYVYDDDPVVVRRRPARVYEEDVVVVRRARPYVPRCRTFIKYDMYGRPYEYKDCD